MRYEPASHRRKPSLLRCKSLARRASCGLRYTAGFRVVRAHERHCAGCLSGEATARELATRARCAALAIIHLCATKGHRTGGSPLSFGARPWRDMPAAGTDAHPAFAWHARERHCAGCLLKEGPARELAARARRATQISIIPNLMKGHCTGVGALSSGARPWCDAPAAASNAKPAFAWHARERHYAG